MAHKNSVELKILLASIKLLILQVEKSEFESLLLNRTINWNKLHQLLAYHKVRPIFLAACNRINFKHEELSHLELFCKIEALRKPLIQNELHVLNASFSEKHIAITPYYSSFYLEYLYNKNSLREADHIKVFVKRKELVLAVQLLIDRGFKLKIEHTDCIEKILTDTLYNYVYLDKKLTNGIHLRIQLYWEMIIESDYSLFSTINTNFSDYHRFKSCDKDFIFKIIIANQSKQKYWLRLQYVVDLLVYIKKYPQNSTGHLLSISEEINLTKMTNLGLSLIESYLSGEKRSSLFHVPTTLSKVSYFWENDSSRTGFYNLCLLFSIYRKTFDFKIPWHTLLIHFFRMSPFI
ncbi:nucleotidyltransferase family protein [Lacihabitans lacunae]|uniref:Nucleotidyltransferase family protein n=1 Tax=Lacihabitans lacunae TaxID=1028214 RepID=A0ABV7Z2B6_9BACT